MAKPMGPGGPGGPGRHGAPIQKPKDAKATISRLLGYIGNQKSLLFVVFICVLISSITNLAGSYMLRPIINTLEADFFAIMEGSSTLEIALTHLTKGIFLMACVYTLSVVTQYLQSRIMVTISQSSIQKIRNDLFEKVQKLPVRFFDTTNHGDIMSRFTNDVDAIAVTLDTSVIQLISGSISLVGTLALMLYTNVWLTLITVVMLPVMMKAAGFVGKMSRKNFAEQQQAIGAVNGYIEEMVTGQNVVKVFCHEEKVIEEFNALNEDLKEKQIKAQFFGGVMGPVMGNLSQISYALTACIGGIFCVTTGFDTGGLAIFVNFSKQFSRPINEISMQINTFFSALAGAERVFDIMDREEEAKDKKDAIVLDDIKGKVVLENVTFGYNEDKVILKNISLYANPGQKIAFVGSTGAGKTTITNLLNRFYDIQKGTITIDDIPITEIKRDSLRSHIAMVLQDTHLFTGTIRENIRYGRLDATDEEVIEAAKIANAHSFIVRLEHGYDTILEGDGANLSQGQRQLLNIARAAISKAPMLILDEATSSVDTRTERHIEQGMDKLMSGRTTFVIAHRLSTVRNANAIMVLENGEIIERGTHEQLLELKGRYYELYTGVVELD